MYSNKNTEKLLELAFECIKKWKISFIQKNNLFSNKKIKWKNI